MKKRSMLGWGELIVGILLIVVLLISIWQLGGYLIDGWKSQIIEVRDMMRNIRLCIFTYINL